MSIRKLSCLWLGLFCVLTLSQVIMAQTAGTGALIGTITDSSGAVVPNVKVTATSADTGQARVTVTGQDGSYRFGLLPPGAYQVKFEAMGFKAVEIPSVKVNVTETNVLNGSLEVGAQTQQVTVQSEVEEVQTTNSTVGTVMSAQNITDLPLTTRNYTNILGLSTGANVGVFNAATLGKGTQDILVNGSSTYQNNFQMDGVSVLSIGNHGNASDSGPDPGIGIANPDAIEEFKIQTSLYDAGYGRTPGANVNVVTKSGTNAFHGTAFEFFRNTDLNANDFFRKASLPVNGVPNNGREILNQNQYGGVIGGPVKKDKLFFFTSYQETWQKNGISSAGASAPVLPPIPTGDRSNTAAFQAALGAVFCPTGTVGGKTSNGGVQVLCDGSNINPVAISILQLKNPDGTYYIPSSSTGGYQNTTFSDPARFTEHQAIGNVDYVINSKNTLTGRWFYSDDPSTYGFWCGASSSTSVVPGTCLPDTGAYNGFSNQYVTIKLTSVLNTSLVNEARISLQRFVTDQHQTMPFTDSQVGMAPIIPSNDNLDEMVISGAASFTIGANFIYNEQKYATAWEIADQISWSHGKHTIRMGVELERDRSNSNFPGDATGSLSFQSFQDFLLGLPGCSPAQITAGCSATNPFPGTNGTATSNISGTNVAGGISVLSPQGLIHAFRWGNGDAFVQDDIKFTSRFTLNLGLRWEYDGLVYDRYGDGTNIWLSLINTVPIPGSTAATGTLAGFVVPSNFNFANNPAPPVGGLFQNNQRIPTQNSPALDNFAPRVGLAWQPLASDRLVVRSGFGYFYDRVSLATYQSGILSSEPYAVLDTQTGAANYFSTLAQPYAPVPLGWTPRWVNFASGASSNLSQNLTQQNIYTPLIYEWNLNVQYEFLPKWVLELGYVGSHGIHQTSGIRQINEAQLVGNPLGTNSIVAPGIAAGLVTTNTVSNASLRVPYLGFSPAGLTDTEFSGDEKYNSLQATVRKQFSHGVTLQAAYTWSKSLTDFGSSLDSNDPNYAGQQYGPNPTYRPQRLSVNYSWDLPSANREGWTGKLLNGWSVSGVTVAQDGTPLTITDTRGGTIFGFGPGSPVTSRAEYASGMGPANVATPGGVEQRLGGSIFGGPGYLNKAAFGTTPVIGNGTGYGDSGVGIILGPGQFNWDMSLVKTTKVGGLREDATLQFRTEFFNAFNHPQFNNPAVLDVSKSTFGQITTSSVNPRLIQFGLKYLF